MSDGQQLLLLDWWMQLMMVGLYANSDEHIHVAVQLQLV